MRACCVAALTLLLITSGVEGSRVLIVPGPVISHCLEMMAVGRELLNRGHDVTLFMVLLDPTFCLERMDTETFGTRFKIRSPNLSSDVIKRFKAEMDTTERSLAEGMNTIKFFLTRPSSMMPKFCRTLFSDPEVIRELELDGYDFALVDGLPFMSCISALAAHLDVPFASVSSGLDWYDSGTPLQSQTFPGFLIEYSNKMTFGQRFLNTLVYFANPIFKALVIPRVDLSDLSERLKGIDTTKLVKDSVLFIDNSDYLFDYPKALMPNYIQVGGLTVTEPKSLSSELRDYMDGAKEGVILVTFGSVLKHIPEKIVRNTFSALKELPLRVLFKHNSEIIDGNIKTMKWIPQNDVLAHDNVKLFISHCGKNSVWESIYHGVPIICTPFATDAWTSAHKVKTHRIGSSMNLREFGPEEILAVVRATLADSEILDNIKRMSSILRSRPEGPAARAASAVEHVMKYGGEHLKSPLNNMYFLSVIYADVWITLFAVVTCIVIFDIWILRKCCCRRKQVSKKKKD